MIIKRILSVSLSASMIMASLMLSAQTKIDRLALVSRHNVTISNTDSLSSLSVGNGQFAFTVDATGLQSFPEHYANGVPLGTQSEWGWHSFVDTAGYKFEESLKMYHANGRDIPYSVQVNQPKHAKEAVNWFRENVHRLQLGNLGFLILKKDGSEAGIKDIKDIRQQLDLWTGKISSHFTVEGEAVDVETYGDQQIDAVGAKVTSNLLKEGRLKIRLRFPFPSNAFSDFGTNYKNPPKHTSSIETNLKNEAVIVHQLDAERYKVSLTWTGNGSLNKGRVHEFILSPGTESNVFELTGSFYDKNNAMLMPATYAGIMNSSITGWKAFWQSGGAVDLSGSTDPRANELERRIVLSQYLTKIQCAGHFPPQETGLTYNSWYGKPHLEMHWWHAAHFALWGRPALLEKSMGWYDKIKGKAKEIATRQGFEGIRWPKMTDPDGNESPSSVGALLIWQQPHFNYFAELEYRSHPSRDTLLKYKDLVFAAADFMASFAYFDPQTNRYILGKGLIPSQEVHKAEDTFNPPYELTYWNWTLRTAQAWRERLKMPRNRKWDEVIAKLSPLPQKDGVYLEAESAPDSYTNPKDLTDHPSTLAAYGMMPLTKMMDTTVMHRTLDLIWQKWTWSKTWGWDFPMTAMTAARLNLPEKAIDALFMPVTTNTFLPNGHNYQDERLTIYLPGNGGLLTAVAMMCAGWDGNKVANPGFPKNGKWKVRWEGLQPMP